MPAFDLQDDVDDDNLDEDDDLDEDDEDSDDEEDEDGEADDVETWQVAGPTGQFDTPPSPRCKARPPLDFPELNCLD
jgi:hypothetical protein